MRIFLLALALLATQAIAAPISHYTVVAKYPHATSNYTEGFLYLNGLFYEGTGMEGRSALIAPTPKQATPSSASISHHRTSAKASSIGVRRSTNGPGSRTSASSMTASPCAWSNSSSTPAKAGA